MTIAISWEHGRVLPMGLLGFWGPLGLAGTRLRTAEDNYPIASPAQLLRWQQVVEAIERAEPYALVNRRALSRSILEAIQRQDDASADDALSLGGVVLGVPVILRTLLRVHMALEGCDPVEVAPTDGLPSGDTTCKGLIWRAAGWHLVQLQAAPHVPLTPITLEAP